MTGSTAFWIGAKEVILLSTRERILAIRLLEKVKGNPAYANALGMEVVKEKLHSDGRINSECAGKTP